MNHNTDFPILDQRVNGKPLVYLDTASTAQKPRQVIEAVQNYYAHDNAGAHRGVHALSVRATAAFEGAREKVRCFLNAGDAKEIVFVRGTTDGINLVAQSFGRSQIGSGDEIVVSTMEHHSNIIPWQIVCEQTGARLRVIPISDEGELDLAAYRGLLNRKTKIVAITHVSNVLGTVNPVKEIIEIAHGKDIPVLVDGAQGVTHQPVDVQQLDCDFYVFSGHKMYSPLGIGVLYGKRNWLERIPPYQGGGGMISQVSFEKTEYAELPYKFEAGSQNISAAVGLGAAIDYVSAIGIDNMIAHEERLLRYAQDSLSEVSSLHIIGQPRERAGSISFVLDGVHPHDVGTILDHEGVAVRVGHHCCMPLMERLGLLATVRASVGVYNTERDIDALRKGLEHVKEIFR